MSLFHKPWFSNPNIFLPNFVDLLNVKLQMNLVISNYLSLKYRRFTQSAWKDKGIRKFLHVAWVIFFTVKLVHDLFIQWNCVPIKMSWNCVPVKMSWNCVPVKMSWNCVPIKMSWNCVPIKMSWNCVPI